MVCLQEWELESCCWICLIVRVWDWVMLLFLLGWDIELHVVSVWWERLSHAVECCVCLIVRVRDWVMLLNVVSLRVRDWVACCVCMVRDCVMLLKVVSVCLLWWDIESYCWMWCLLGWEIELNVVLDCGRLSHADGCCVLFIDRVRD